MALYPTPTNPESAELASLFDIEAAEIETHLVVLDELLAIGMNLARRIDAQVTTDNIGATAVAYERVARAVRRCILLSHRLSNSRSAADRLETRQAAETKASIRAQLKAAIADAATTTPKNPADPGELRAPRDRLESIGNAPTHEIIASLCRDITHAAHVIVQPLKTKPPLERRQPATPNGTIRPHRRTATKPLPTPNLKSEAPARGSG